MSLFQTHKLEKAIKKSISETLSDISGDTPAVVFQTHYGAIQIDPAHLVIWYFFDKDSDWHQAERNGLTDKIRKTTICHLIDNGYPLPAFEDNYSPMPGKIKILNTLNESSSEKDIEKMITDSLTHYRVMISFASQEDVQNKANGNYYYYFK